MTRVLTRILPAFMIVAVAILPSAESQVTAALEPGCTFYPAIQSSCSFSCALGDYILVNAYGVSGGGLADCGGSSAQCIVDNSPLWSHSCIDFSPPLDSGDRIGTCLVTGADLETTAPLGIVQVTCGTTTYVPLG